MCKKAATWLLLFFGLAAAVGAADLADVKAQGSCKHCGMDREKFAQSRMWLEYEGAAAVGTCSLNCAAVDLDASKNKRLKSVRVADRDTKELVDASEAAWVIGGEKPGVMTRTAKWAFGTKGAAEAFVQANGGKVATYEEALQATRDEIAERGSKAGGSRRKGCCDK